MPKCGLRSHQPSSTSDLTAVAYSVTSPLFESRTVRSASQSRSTQARITRHRHMLATAAIRRSSHIRCPNSEDTRLSLEQVTNRDRFALTLTGISIFNAAIGLASTFGVLQLRSAS